METGYGSFMGMGYKFMAGVKERSHGADPAAEKAAEYESKTDEDERRPHQRYQCFGSQGRTCSKKRVYPEEDVYRIGKIIGTGIISLDKQKKKKKKTGYLAQSAPKTQG